MIMINVDDPVTRVDFKEEEEEVEEQGG